MSKFFRLKTASHHLMRPAQTSFEQGSFSARLGGRESGMMLFAARLTSVASARSSPRTYRHTGTGSLRPLQYLDGCAGPFSAAHGFRNFFCLTFATGPFRAVTAKPRCIGTAVPGVPGLAGPRVRVAEFSVSCPPSNKGQGTGASTAVLSPSSIFPSTWIPFPLSLALHYQLSIVRNPPVLA
ncbi:hypothetical protein J3E68DRAFT_342015 [Trichoderma sp. SZMC 28012]